MAKTYSYSKEDIDKNSRYLFGIYRELGEGDVFWFALAEDDGYGQFGGYLSDVHIDENVSLPEGCFEEAESIFVSPYDTYRRLYNALIKAGFKYSENLEGFINDY